MSELYEHIGRKIRELRGSLSQENLAAGMKIAPNTISRWETGTYKPTAEDLDKLARFFDVPITVFFPELQGKEDDRVTALASAVGGLGEKEFQEVVRYAQFRKAEQALQQGNRSRTKR